MELWPDLKALYPHVRTVYRPSDPLVARLPEDHPLHAAERQVVQEADVVLLVNQLAAQRYRALGDIGPEGDETRVHVLPNGLDLAAYRQILPRPASFGAAGAQRVVAYVGASGPHWEAILAAAEAHPHLLFHVTCPVRPHVAVARRIGALPNLHHQPGVAPQDVPALVQHADVVMVPYPDACRTWTRGLHAKLYQAMAAQRPIVGLNLGTGISEPGIVQCDSVDQFLDEVAVAAQRGSPPHPYAVDLNSLDWSRFRSRMRQAVGVEDVPS